MARATATGRHGVGCAERGLRARSPGARRQAGFTYLAVLLLVALIGLGLASVGVLWATASQRELERELLFVGDQYRQAIGSYYERTPGGGKQYPTSLEQLLRDERYPVVVRHLRRIYRDPMTGKTDWVLVSRPDGRIVGVASRSKKPPLKIDNFDNPLDRDFRGSQALSEWKFIYSPGSAVVPQQKSAGAAGEALPAFPTLPSTAPSSVPSAAPDSASRPRGL